jgi:hypothetical protein
MKSQTNTLTRKERDENFRFNRSVDTARRVLRKGERFTWTADGWVTPSLARPIEDGALNALWRLGEAKIDRVERVGVPDLVAKAAERPATSFRLIKGIHDHD